MNTFLSLTLIALLLSILAGLIRVFRGPAPAERMLAAQLFGTAAVAILLVLSQLMQMPALLDVAMVFALLAAVTLVGFVVLASRGVR
ncbi:multisubunit sodium/proton antiporter MrpF subunit [Roseinatronobacter thiooxidans]|uniref:Multisubunit sodium/proton antiporter MrpF subunit n=1 Tax=Roseinatronobacter thiooxidans TaxID=121821 RepID=A0A2W7PTI5_9RHOB|nr:monovalent cation/H+ antiporter complex subunit F [Roseinatronobacter thiooxidans]PZX39531.1 multisubunit sodium/proton antiporter MrpF subunit [Roseinatronobacter thiooxidans]